jgi:flavin reductase (DIM6/NTAB) family NADH-FMN oxidoreductase RutF
VLVITPFRGGAGDILDIFQRNREIRMAVPAEVFKAAMRHFPAAVNIITCAHKGIARGLTATAVCSLCADPAPSLLACVNRGSSTYPLLRQSRAFAVNVLSAQHRDLAKLFASLRLEHRAERFRSGAWSSLVSGAPILDGAIVAFDCELARELEHGTHSILVGTIVDVRIAAGAAHLLYVGGGFAEINPPDDCHSSPCHYAHVIESHS